MTPEQAYDWLAPKLSTQERQALDLIYGAVQPEAVAIVQRHRRHVELSPGAGEEVQRYALAVCDDILSDLGCTMNVEKPHG